MTDASGSADAGANGSVETLGVGGAGAPAAPNGNAGGEGSPQAPADPFAGLETGARDWVGKKGYKNVSDVVQAALSAESLIGKSVQVPGENATTEDWNKFYSRLGRPEKADGYEFRLPDGVPKEMPYDGDFATAFKSESAYPLGLTAKQAAGVHDWFVKRAAGNFTAQGKASTEAFEKRVIDATTALEAKWGTRDSDPFKAKVESAHRALNGLAEGKLVDKFKQLGMLADLDGQTIVVDPDLAFALSDIGDKLYREDSLVGGSGSAALANPFSEGPDKGNATEQNRLWKSDQARAEQMIRAAGFTPEQFGYKRAAA